MKMASLVSPCCERAVPPRTMRVRGRSFSEAVLSAALVSGMSVLLRSRPAEQKTPTAEEVRVAFRQRPDLLAVCLTWPQAGRLKSPRVPDAYRADGALSSSGDRS